LNIRKRTDTKGFRWIAKKAIVKGKCEKTDEIRISSPVLETSTRILFQKSFASLIGNYFLTHDETTSFFCFFESLCSSINQHEKAGRLCVFLVASLQDATGDRSSSVPPTQTQFPHHVTPASRSYVHVSTSLLFKRYLFIYLFYLGTQTYLTKTTLFLCTLVSLFLVIFLYLLFSL
jgi:hypothetical protein